MTAKNARQSATMWERIDNLNNCPGCGQPPFHLLSFGRHKFACATYTARSASTTRECVGNITGPTFHRLEEAVMDWNSATTQ